jgi:hypothetical protein
MLQSAEPAYKIGETVTVQSWTGSTPNAVIVDVSWEYHHRMAEYGWHYRFNKDVGLALSWVPEGYIKANE